MTDLGPAISRVRRAMPRNADVMAICAEVERLTAEVRALRAPKPKTDRKLYMREFMRKKRALQRTAKANR